MNPRKPGWTTTVRPGFLRPPPDFLSGLQALAAPATVETRGKAKPSPEYEFCFVWVSIDKPT
jgi:hypothetical protein